MLSLTWFSARLSAQLLAQRRELAFVHLADTIVASMERNLDDRLRGLEYLQSLAVTGTLEEPRNYELVAEAIHRVGREFLAVNLIGPDRRIQRVWPAAGNEKALGQIVGKSPEIIHLLELARDDNVPKATGVVDLFQGGKGIVTYYPVWRDGQFRGYVNGVFRIDGFKELVANPAGTTRINVEFLAPGTGTAGASEADMSVDHRIHILDRDIAIRISGQDPNVSGAPDPFAWGWIVFGIATSVAISILVYVALSKGDLARERDGVLSGMLKASADAIVSVDRQSVIRLFNPAAEEMFGVSAGEMLGAKLESLLPEGSRAVHAGHVDAFAAEQRQRRVMGDWRVIAARRADGHLFPVLVSLSKSEIAGEVVMTASLRDMSDTKRMQDELIALANERERHAIRAEDANRAKSMFLATMSHELRTPLNAIIGFSDIAAREALGPLGNAKYKEYMEDIKASGELLLSHINDVLDLARIEADAYEMRPETVDVSEIITSCRRMTLVAQESKALRVTVTGEAGLIASVDRKAVQQVLLNLLSNAIKFSRQGGTIELGSRRFPEDRFEIWVTDTGCGMTAKDLERIGQPFVQLGNHYHAEVKGTGLGLSICRALLIRMGGHMAIRSEPEVGTTVTFDLPIAAVSPEAA